MGSTNISAIGKAVVQSQSAGVNSDIREEDEKISFLDMMNQMTAQPGDELFSQAGTENEKTGQVLKRTQAAAGDYDRYQFHENGVRGQKTSKLSGADERVTGKLSAYEKDVKEVLKEELGVTDEQIEEAMKTLGLAIVDLMNPKMLAELVMKLTDCQNISELLCNGEFLSVMQNVNELTESLLNELGISPDELSQMLEVAAQPPDTVTDDVQNTQEVTTAETPENETEPVAAEETEKVNQDTALQVEEDTAEEAVTDKMAGKKQEEISEEVRMPEKDAKTEPVSDNAAFKGGQPSENSYSQDGMGHAQTVWNQAEAAPVQVADAAAGFTGQVDVADIIKQISEFTRLTVGNAATTMEMQLNPENLGKIYLEITSKAGTVSAHITAQNEIVKEALEAQLVTLKENMNQAGVKVDAVEVTVGSHEFEKNLEQNAKQEERQAEEQAASAKRTRSINLNDLDELNGIMTEEESLVAQMMAEQGNSVDFTA